MANADKAWRNDTKGVDKLVAVLIRRLANPRSLCLGIHAGEPNEHHAGVYSALPKHQFTKIFVCGKQYRITRIRLAKHRIVGQTGRMLCNAQHIMTILPQASDNGLVDAFIGNELHATQATTG